MRIGIQWFNTDETIAPGRLAKEIEDRGFASLFVTEHTHIPVTERAPMPAVYGGVMPEFYKRSLDPFVALSFAGAATTTLQLGTAICLVGQRDPFITAKEVATLDHLTDGRFEFGIGYGWNREEAEACGLDWKHRFSIVREKVSAIRALWNTDEAEFDGRYVQMKPSWSYPKPAKAPPILLSGAGPIGMQQAALWADGWFPAPKPDDPTLRRSIAAYRRCEKENERTSPAQIVVSTLPPDATVLSDLREQGVSQALIALYPEPGTDAALRFLDVAAKVLHELR